ncbi:MAG TPA: hypothetical protein VFO49_14790 [Nocardioides sp.]|nr:hypothetical protein [Nocardioides sp.]
MRRGGTAGLLAGTLGAVLLLAGCSDDDDEPVFPPDPEASVAPPAYDPELEPAAAVLALVPDAATVLTVTDFDQLRLQLGTPTLTSADPAPERAEFWREVDAETAALTEGLLRPIEDQLAEDYGFTQDDVLWEAHFDGGGVEGWVLRFRDDLDMSAVRRAVDDGVGPLDGVQVAAEQRVVGVEVASHPDESWAADVELTELVGSPAAATYLERDCIPFDDAFGSGVREQLATGPDEDMSELAELGPFSVAFGSDLVTARLGPARPDVFARARLADTMPETDPSFGEGFQRPVADPSTGRIGYSLGDPRAAAELTLARHLPFAVCADS